MTKTLQDWVKMGAKEWGSATWRAAWENLTPVDRQGWYSIMGAYSGIVDDVVPGEICEQICQAVVAGLERLDSQNGTT